MLPVKETCTALRTSNGTRSLILEERPIVIILTLQNLKITEWLLLLPPSPKVIPTTCRTMVPTEMQRPSNLYRESPIGSCFATDSQDQTLRTTREHVFGPDGKRKGAFSESSLTARSRSFFFLFWPSLFNVSTYGRPLGRTCYVLPRDIGLYARS